MSTVIALHPHTRRERTRGEQARPTLRVVPTVSPVLESSITVFEEDHPLRLTRRGRFVVQAAVTVLVLLAVVAGVLLIGRSAEAGQQSADVPLGYHVVLPGETMWQIAGEVAPAVDRRDAVDDLMELNALSTSAVSVGQRIAYPLTDSRP